jgi:hypothetical protein
MSNLTHRVIRPFPLDGKTAEIGALVSDAEWSAQGKYYVESMGWALPLTDAEMAEANSVPKPVEVPLEETIGEISDGAPVAKSPTIKPQPVKKAVAKKKPTKKSPTIN